MPMIMEELLKPQSQMLGVAASDRPLLSPQDKVLSNAHQNIEFSPNKAGSKQEVLNAGKWCVQCGRSKATHAGMLCKTCRYNNRCVDCNKLIAYSATRCKSCATKLRNNLPEQKPTEKTICPVCKGRKQSRSRTCLPCYRKKMIKRNMLQAGPLALARERIAKSGNSRKRQSKVEKKAEELLVRLGLNYQSQQRFGRYIADFVLPDYSLVVEVNGRYWHSSPEQVERDHKKRQVIEGNGMRLLVLWDDESHLWILQLCEVLGRACLFQFMT